MAAVGDIDAATQERMAAYINAMWDSDVIPLMEKYIAIPNQSPDFDPEWHTNGLLEEAMQLLEGWARKQPVAGMQIELLQERGTRTPFLVIEIPATDASLADPSLLTTLMYGHMDKQPPLHPWDEGLDPYKPVIRDGRLYGRGGADDGYAICASLLTVMALQREGIPHGRIAIVIEACEESGSGDLDYWIEKTKSRFGDVGLVICLDSGALTYDRVWLTSSLRGVFNGLLKVEVLKEGMHSGIGGGVAPDTTRVARMLLDRVEDVKTGDILLKELQCEIPPAIIANYQAINDIGAEFLEQYPTLPGVSLGTLTNAEFALKNYWGPSMTITGADGLPQPKKAGNVLRQWTTFKLSFRCPPTVDANAAAMAVKRELEREPPYGARTSFHIDAIGEGWAAPLLQPWLDDAMRKGSREAFGRDFGEVGLGGSIPFMGMLGRMFPRAQFVVTGVLGPHSNAHGPNEFLDITFGKKVNYVVTRCLLGFTQSLRR